MKVIFDIEKLKSKKQELVKKTQQPNFWDDNQKAASINKRINDLDNQISTFNNIKQQYNQLNELYEMLEQDFDQDLYQELKQNISKLDKQVNEVYIQTLLNAKYDDNNAILEIHSGAGGTEAQDWVEMLYRMYERFSALQGYKFKVLDQLQGDTAGIKRVSVLISGFKAYGYLKAERGVHRLVRISPFDSNNRRHTSFASVKVMPEVETDDEVDLQDKDLKIDTYKSSGAGGQHVNTTDSAVRITHLKSGIVVTCQNERSQIQNRETALKMLKSKLIEIKERKQLEEIDQIKGGDDKNEWGSQIRSYIFHPYNLVKDHRTGYETSSTESVMNGEIKEFIIQFLKTK